MGTFDDFFSTNYTRIFDRKLTGEEGYLEADFGEKRCRFCGKSESEVTFRSKAHAVPKMLGNPKLISPNE